MVGSSHCSYDHCSDNHCTDDHFSDLHTILTKLQHGFRSGLSCETQLLETTNDFLSSLDAGEQVGNKASKVLGLCQRNLKHCPQRLKEFVRSTLDKFCASIWDPYLAAEKRKLETIQRRAARFFTRDYHRTTSVAGLLSRLEWRILEERRRRAGLTLLFKIKNNMVGIDANQYLTPADPRTREDK